jgi:hypothetical protein
MRTAKCPAFRSYGTRIPRDHDPTPARHSRDPRLDSRRTLARRHAARPRPARAGQVGSLARRHAGQRSGSCAGLRAAGQPGPGGARARRHHADAGDRRQSWRPPDLGRARPRGGAAAAMGPATGRGAGRFDAAGARGDVARLCAGGARAQQCCRIALRAPVAGRCGGWRHAARGLHAQGAGLHPPAGWPHARGPRRVRARRAPPARGAEQLRRDRCHHRPGPRLGAVGRAGPRAGHLRTRRQAGTGEQAATERGRRPQQPGQHRVRARRSGRRPFERSAPRARSASDSATPTTSCCRRATRHAHWRNWAA